MVLKKEGILINECLRFKIICGDLHHGFHPLIFRCFCLEKKKIGLMNGFCSEKNRIYSDGYFYSVKSMSG
jgi:hypothetical protein